jgi:hypothetical protein
VAKRTKLTNNSDEADISQLLSGDSIFYIPYFQRPYKWKRDNLIRLQQDALNIVDGTTDNHFLGAVIIHGRRANPSEPTIYDVIDGQQRITTIFLYIAATIKILSQNGHVDEAVALFQKYMSLGRQPKGMSNVKLHPCKEDRKQINEVLNDLTSNVQFREKLGSFTPQLLPSTGKDKGPLRQNYRSALRFLAEQYKQGAHERVQQIYQAFLESMSVVQIDVWDPTNGPKIFDSLNSRQEPMTIGDLVRNEIFSKVSSDTAEHIDQIDETYWQPFYKKFQQDGKNLFDGYFFPFGLISDPNLTKSDVYNSLRKKWEATEDPKEIISDLSVYQNAFIDIVCETNHQTHSKEVSKWLNRLTRMGLPTSTYPFLMALSQAIKNESIEPDKGIEVLEAIESFLVRRAICGIEPTGLHAVFKRLWFDIKEKPTWVNVRRAIQEHKTVSWPSDDDLRSSVLQRPLYGAAITPYFLRQYDNSLGGDAPKDIAWIEHILPQTMSDPWRKSYSDEQHKKYVNILANLIPLSSEMNSSLRNSDYATKAARYASDSMFKSARELAKSYKEWTPASIDARANHLAEWAVGRWKRDRAE